MSHPIPKAPSASKRSQSTQKKSNSKLETIVSDSSDSEPPISRYSLRRTAGRASKRAQEKAKLCLSIAQSSTHNQSASSSTQAKQESKASTSNTNKKKATKRRSSSSEEGTCTRRITRSLIKVRDRPALTSPDQPQAKKVKEEKQTKSNPSTRRLKTGQKGSCNPEQATTGNNCTTSSNCLLVRNTVYPEGSGTMAEGGSRNHEANANANNQPPLNANQHNDPEIGRLQAMLEARGLPSNLFGSLGPRMQSLLGRAASVQPNSRISQLLSGMTGDESHTLQCVIELCDLLVMGNEETLGPHFPVKEVVKALMSCLKMEHNFDIMNNACRALTYLMEALPRSSPVVVEAVPLLIERLHRIECMDVAEHALTALQLLSTRHAKNILLQGGICACLQFLDFFSLVSQRAALQIASNCCAYLTVDEFSYVKESIPALILRLNGQDKKCVECVCTLFTRLVDNFLGSQEKLMEMTSTGLLKNVQQLLVITPPLISTSTFVGIIRMLHLLCAHCTELAVILLKQNIGVTLRYLLIGSHENLNVDVELVARTPQEQHEIVLLIGELMPRLPRDGVFQVESMMKRAPPSEHVVWSWKDDRQLWRPYTNIDSRILEAAYQSRETEVSLNAMGNTYTVDLENMMQVNDDTGTSRQVQRRMTPAGLQAGATISVKESRKDARLTLLIEDPSLHEEIVTSLFPVCYEVYSSSAGPAIRHECIRSILRMICHTSPEVLSQVLNKLPLSSHIANMLSSSDLKLVVGAVQLVRVLLDKLPEIFSVYFKKEGVMHQIEKLTVMSLGDGAALKSASDSSLPQLTGPALNLGPVSSSINLSMPNNNTAYGLHELPPYCMLPQALTTTPRMPIPINDPLGLMGFRMPTPNIPPPPFLAPCRFPQAPPVVMDSEPPQQTEFIVGTPPLREEGGVDNNNKEERQGERKEGEQKREEQKREDGDSNKSVSSKPRSVRSASTASNITVATVITKRRMHEDSVNEGGRATKLHSSVRHSSDSYRNKNAPSTRSRLRQQYCQDTEASSAKATSRKVVRSGAHRKASSVSESTASSPPKKDNASSSKKAGAAAYLSDKLSSLPLPKWARPGSKETPQVATNQPDPVLNLHRVSVANFGAEYARVLNSTSAMSRYFSVPTSAQYQQLMNTQMNSQASVNKEKVRAWIRNQAEHLMENFFKKNAEKDGDEEQIIDKLTGLATSLLEQPSEANLCGVLDLVIGQDLSAFEMIHSGIIASFVQYLTKEKGRQARVATFAKLFMGLKVGKDRSVNFDPSAVGLLRLVQRLNACLSQQEQFPLKVHELPAGPQGSLRGANALRFFHSHQIKVAAIERYMLLKGYGRIKNETKEEDTTDDDNSDDDLEEAMSANSILARGQHRIELLLNDKVLPYDMSLFQAVRQYGLSGHTGSTDTDTDGDMNTLNYATIWVNTHNLWYRLAPDEQTTPQKKSAAKGNENSLENKNKRWSSNKARASPKNDPLWNEGIVPECRNPLDDYLVALLPVQINDPCHECLCLLRILYGLNRYWYNLYPDHVPPVSGPIIPYCEFVNTKLSAKVTRQLQDPLTVLSQQVPPWIKLLAKTCPFVLPLECRQSLLYCTAFDRDRALQHLLDTVPDLNLHDSHAGERITPRLERRKMCIQRTDLLKQAEAVLNNMADGSKAVLEIQYQNEEGTGLGPTLEFYSLVSKELQKYILEIWRGEKINAGEEDYAFNGQGLYPLAVPRCIKSQAVNKIKQKFTLMGKLMARALLDSRMMDISLSPLFFSWLLGQERGLSVADLIHMDPVLLKSIHSLIKPDVTALEIESMDLDFTLVSGSHTVELKKGGKDILVTAENVHQYVQLVTHWLLVEGVQRQMEALLEGFEKVVPLKHLTMFYPEEMEQLFCGSRASDSHWESNVISSCLRPDHGYTHDSQPVKWLVEMMSSFDENQRRRFLQFITGSPRLPVGGFKSLNPPLTVVRKGPVSGEHGDEYLPSVMTCVNYLKLPHYSTLQVMIERFESAMKHGQSSFYLS